MKRVAIPIIKGALSEYFGQCHHYEIFDLDGKKIKRQKEEFPMVKKITELPEWISGNGITDVVAYRIDKSIINLFARYKINVYVGVLKSNPKEIIKDYLKGSLSSDNRLITEIITNTD